MEKWGWNRDKTRIKPLYIGTGTIFAPAFLSPLDNILLISFIAAKMERAGTDAIELGLSSPVGEGFEVIAANPSKVYVSKRPVLSVHAFSHGKICLTSFLNYSNIITK